MILNDFFRELNAMTKFGYWTKVSYFILSVFSIYLCTFHGQPELSNYRLLPKIAPIFLATWQIEKTLKTPGIPQFY